MFTADQHILIRLFLKMFLWLCEEKFPKNNVSSSCDILDPPLHLKELHKTFRFSLICFIVCQQNCSAFFPKQHFKVGEDTDESEYDFVLSQGTSTLTLGRTVSRAMSLMGWSATLTSMPPELTGVKSNFWTPPWLDPPNTTYPEPHLTPVMGNQSPFPVVFQV